MGIKSMQGTSSYLEYIGPVGKKRRKSCIFYKDNKCMCKNAQSYLMKCVGRLCCGKFSDREEDREKLECDFKEIINYRNNTKSNKKRKKKDKNKTLNSKGRVLINDSKNTMLGKNIKLKSLKTKEVINIKIVRLEEESIFNRRYSIGSNFGMAVRGKVVGEVIKVNIVNGYESYEILDIY